MHPGPIGPSGVRFMYTPREPGQGPSEDPGYDDSDRQYDLGKYLFDRSHDDRGLTRNPAPERTAVGQRLCWSFVFSIQVPANVWRDF
jgi:hypothetical protein